MFEFSIMTSFTIIIITFILSLILMLFIWRKYRAIVEGTDYFLLSFVLMIVGALLISFRPNLTDFTSIIIANIILFIGKFALLFGVMKFYKIKIKYTYVFIGLLIYTLCFLWFTYFYPSTLIRIIISALSFAIVHTFIFIAAANQFKNKKGSAILSAISILSIFYYMLKIAIILFNRESYNNIFEYDPIIILFEGLMGILTVIGIYDIISNRIFSESIESERSKNQLLDNIPGFAYRCNFDENWTMKFLSKSFYDITGYDVSEIIDNNVLSYGDIIADEYKEIVYKAFEEGAKENKTVKIEYEIYKKNGEKMWVWEQAKCLYEPDGNILAVEGHISDISERKQLEKKNRLLEVQLRNQQKLESIGTLASGVAHEINNPINGIMNYGQIISDLTDSGTEINNFAREIISESNRVSTIVRNLLGFSRKSGVRHSYSDIEEIINKTVSLIKTIFKYDNIDIDIAIENNISKIKCNSQQIQQILMNLLTNARDSLNKKYSGYNENKRIFIECSELTIKKRKWIEITVKDLGMGIDPEIKHRIFDPFFTTKAKDKGTGLGLSISYGIVQDHKGFITVKSEPCEYTEFSILLPCDDELEVTN